MKLVLFSNGQCALDAWQMVMTVGVSRHIAIARALLTPLIHAIPVNHTSDRLWLSKSSIDYRCVVIMTLFNVLVKKPASQYEK